MRVQYTFWLRDEYKDQGLFGRRIGDMQFSCPEPKSASTVDMPGDPRQWRADVLSCLEKVSSSHTSTTPTASRSSESGSIWPAVGRKVAPQPAALCHPLHTHTVDRPSAYSTAMGGTRGRPCHLAFPVAKGRVKKENRSGTGEATFGSARQENARSRQAN